MGINRIKYVNIDSGTEDTDFVKFTDMGEVTASITITENGVYYAPNDIAGYKKVTVNVSGGGEINNQDITVTENGVYEAGQGYTGLGTVTVEVPEPTYETLYVTENGTYIPTADGYSEVEVNVAGGQATIVSLEINPTVLQQYITPTSGVNGYAPITVNAVTAAIDSNIQPENIVVGKEILGVSGIAVASNETTLEVNPTTSAQTLTPTSPYTGFNEVSVNAVTAAIDNNITSENIKSGVSILGVSGSVVESNETSLNITPSTSAQSITPSSPYTGYDEINVSAVDSSIDANIIPANIVNGVEILGVTGSADILNGSTATVTPTTSQQIIEPASPSNGLTSVTVNAVTSAIDNNIIPGNIKSGVSILGVNGSVTEANETTLNITPSTSAQQLTPSSPYTGFDEVNVSAVTSSIDANITSGNIKSGVSILGVNGSVEELNATTLGVTPTTSAQTLTPTSPYNGFDEVNVSAVTAAIDSNIIAGNIKSGVNILGVIGTYNGGQAPTYNLGDTVYDDSNNLVGTVYGFFVDSSNNTRYAVVLLAPAYHTSGAIVTGGGTTPISGLPQYNQAADGKMSWRGETATSNCDAILAFCSQLSITSPAVSACRALSFVINGTTYYGQLPNYYELLQIVSAANISGISLDEEIWSSTQQGDYTMWAISCASSDVINTLGMNRFNSNPILPILEIPV